jgi:PiT family inorganic phosphate transporter
MPETILIAFALFMALSNGANDNFKGFATVWGSDTLDYRQALILATIATVAGSLVSLLVANGLVGSFSGKGLVPDAVVNAPSYMLAVAGGASLTVFLATRLGLPVSTTHALIGGLAGAGMGLSDDGINWAPLAGNFLAPLLISPLIAAALSMAAGRLPGRGKLQTDCVCLVEHVDAIQPVFGGAGVQHRSSLPQLVIASAHECERLNTPLRVSAARTLERLHILSAMSICFARAVNDTPKLAALLLTANLLGAAASVVWIAAAMGIGGLIFATRVAHTMSQRMTRIGSGDGLAANVITAVLVLFASKFGLPVSTTHVAVGAIAGVGAGSGSLNWHTLRSILLSWVATLPLAAAVAFAIASLI